MKVPFVVLCILIGVSFGCASRQRAETANRAQSELVGMKKVELLTCAGVPERQERVGDMEFLSYSSGGDSVDVGVATKTSRSTSIYSGRSNRRYCGVTFILKDGIVQKVNYQGRTGGLLSRGEQCAFVVENCLNR